MSKKDLFRVREIEENNITVEELRKERSPFLLFLLRNRRLIFILALVLSLTILIIALYLILSNMKETNKTTYESNGVVVNFEEKTTSAVIDGIPITEEYASKVFNNVKDEINTAYGVVIKIKEIKLNNRTIVFYSDKTALVKYENGTYLKISSVNGSYGVDEKGVIDSRATVKKLKGEIKENKELGITILYLADNSIEITKDNTVIFVRDNDITTSDKELYTNMSIISVPIKEEDGKLYYSKGTIKEDNYLIVDGKKYGIKEEKTVIENIKIIYYENGYAEVIKDGLSIIVENSSHIRYDNYIFEIVKLPDEEIKYDIEDIVDIKNITLNNISSVPANYIIVLEETNNYKKHNVQNILSSKYINYMIDINGTQTKAKSLNETVLIDNKYEGLNKDKNNYVLYEGTIESLSELPIKLGMWIDYRSITNQYMNSSFIGTIKIYVESLS